MQNVSGPLKFLVSLFLTVFPLFLAGCGSDSSVPSDATSASFAVVSDPHLYDGDTLGAAGADFETYLARDRKMLVESREILSAVIDNVKSKKLDFVIVTGDLTKDGELANHRLMAAKLAELKASGKKVYVIPGNHDINNPHAVSFKNSPPAPVDKVTPDDFRRIYADFGYKDALYRDADSLSYIVEPVRGLWLFALDSCKYSDNFNNGAPTTSGSFSAATRAWIIERLKEAKTKGKTVMGMMHHGILEHFTGQSQQFPEYVLDDWSNVSKSLSENGLNVVFTGHFHADDVTRKDFIGSALYDIETGSLVSYPSPYRIVDFDIAGKKLTINTEHVTAIPSHTDDFIAYSKGDLQAGLDGITRYRLAHHPYNLTDPALSSVAALVVSGMMAHYAGDEAPDAATLATCTAMMGSADPVTIGLGRTLASLWTDQPPGDNNVSCFLGSDSSRALYANSSVIRISPD